MMAPANFSLNVRRTFLVVELILLITSLILLVQNVRFQLSQVTLFWQIALSSAFIYLGLVFPVDSPLWQKRLYIFVEITLLVIAQSIKISFDALIYLFLLKSCFLLPRRDVVLVAIASGAAQMINLAQILPTEIEVVRQRGIEPYLNPSNILLSNLISFIGTSTFVILAGFVWTAEQKSRHKAEALTKQVETLAADLERNRIARDIHDSLGHSLTTLDVQLELAQRIYGNDPYRAAKSLDIAKQLSSQCLLDVRLALKTMHQSNFDLNEALIALTEQVKQNQPFQVHLDLHLPKLSLQTSHQIYCIVREGFSNVQKHAHASQVILRGQHTHEAIVLEIQDNGKGFDPDRQYSGFGLQGIQERVRIMGGQVNVKSKLNQGTTVKVTIPTLSCL